MVLLLRGMFAIANAVFAVSEIVRRYVLLSRVEPGKFIALNNNSDVAREQVKVIVQVPPAGDM